MSSRNRTVAVLLDDPRNLYQQWLAQEAHAWAGRNGVTLLPTEWAAGSAWSQIESINTLLRHTSPPDGMLLMLAGGITRSSVERLLKAGVAVALLNRIPPWVNDVRAAVPKGLLVGVAPRQEGVGELLARHALRLARAGGFAVQVAGDMTSVAAARRAKGFMAAVGSRLKVHTLEGRWSASLAEQALHEWFRTGVDRDRPIDVIVCHNDAMAAGVKRALGHQAGARIRADLTKVPIVGVDGLPQEGKAMLERGEIAATVIIPASTPPALEALRRSWAAGASAALVELEGIPLPPL